MTASGSSLPIVLLVGSGLTGGGAEGRFRTLAANLFDGSADVAVFTATSGSVAEFGSRIVVLRWAGASSYPRLIWKLSQCLRARRYDVVVAFGLFPGVLIALARLLASTSTRYLYSEIASPIQALNELSGWRRLVYRRLWVFIARSYDFLSANSKDGLDDILRFGRKSDTNGFRLHNLVDVNRLSIVAGTEPGEKLPSRYFLWYGRLVGMKRVDTIIEAFAQLSSDFPDVNLVIVGDGEARSVLQRLAADSGLGDSVFFLGQRDNPFPILARATAFVLASEHEGFSNSLIEAMFMDVPVVTSYCSSDARTMCAAGAALGFEVGDAVGLAMLMRAILEDTAVGERVRQSARTYRAPHELFTSLAEYEELLRRCAG